MNLKNSLLALVICWTSLVSLQQYCSAQSIGGRFGIAGGTLNTTQPINTQRYPYVIARGADRQVIQNTPIEQRPNRPLHFYGNFVRRNGLGR
jgi:hypothetical protein